MGDDLLTGSYQASYGCLFQNSSHTRRRQASAFTDEQALYRALRTETQHTRTRALSLRPSIHVHLGMGSLSSKIAKVRPRTPTSPRDPATLKQYVNLPGVLAAETLKSGFLQPYKYVNEPVFYS